MCMGAGPQLGRHLPTVAIDRDLGSCARYLGGDMPAHMTDPRSNEPPRLECHDASRAMPRIPRDETAELMRAETSRMIDLEIRRTRNGKDRAPEADPTQADGID